MLRKARILTRERLSMNSRIPSNVPAPALPPAMKGGARGAPGAARQIEPLAETLGRVEDFAAGEQEGRRHQSGTGEAAGVIRTRLKSGTRTMTAANNTVSSQKSSMNASTVACSTVER